MCFIIMRRKQLSKKKITVLALASICALIYLNVSGGLVPVGTQPSGWVEQVVIDAGHGGVDGGAIGAHGVVEKDINLNIALMVRDMLRLNGVDVVMTRDTDTSIHDPKYTKIADKKRSDIHNRLKIIDKNPNSITVSIHQNKFTQSQYRGAQMFYGKNNAASEILAQNIQETFVANLQKDNVRQIKEGTKSVYLLCHAKTPIVLVECGFLSNEEEAYLLATEEYQQKVAFTIYSGILRYMESSANPIQEPESAAATEN